MSTDDFKKYLDEEIEKSPYAKKEEAILHFWNEQGIFKKTLNKDAPKGDFVFYEGPPTANGRPGIHHLLARSFKDAIPRYKTMQGFHVRRKAGWDTHGLPVELQVEKELGLKSKKDIEKYGIDKFNEKCRESVWTYVNEWKDFTDRVGYWVDMEHPYVTYNPQYVESVWWVMKQIADQDLLYKDYKIVPWCPRCGTGLSSHELAQGYKDVKDISITAKFELIPSSSPNIGEVPEAEGYSNTSPQPSPASGEGAARTYVLAWTTTPWTLPGNVALAVGEDITYVKAKKVTSSPLSSSGEASPSPLSSSDEAERRSGDPEQIDTRVKPEHDKDVEFVIVAKELAEKVLGNDYELVADVKGSDLVGKKYKPLFPYFTELAEKQGIEGLDNAFKIYSADFVTTEDGTGIVHTAVMYGQDDFDLGAQIGLPKMHLVNDSGQFVDGVGEFSGRSVKEVIDDKPTMDVDIIKYLQEHNTFFSKEKYEHSYPHCWRCKTPLIYYARDSWYINMQKVKQQLIDENQEINWKPEHVRDGRFGDWLADLKDWAISRERYWGTPLPVWQAEDGEQLVIGGYDDIYQYTDNVLTKAVLLRHGESEKNIKGVCDSSDDKYPLTEQGVQEARDSAQQLQGAGIEIIYSSPVRRARETAEIVAKELGLEIQIVEGLREAKSGEWEDLTYKQRLERPDGKAYAEMDYDDYYTAVRGKTGESWKSHGERIEKTLTELVQKNAGKTVLFVGHQPLIAYGEKVFKDLTPQETGTVFDGPTARQHAHPVTRYVYAETMREFDPHRPFVDDIVLKKDGKEFCRVSEVMDVWFDSGSMPFAQDHYPFEKSPSTTPQSPPQGGGEALRYPADYISEGMDQTRGWFYTMHAIGNLLGKGKAYKNVISLGLINDENGQKMSKSKGNTVSPWYATEKFGVDTIRFWMYSVSGPGDAKSFDEKTIIETQRKVFGLLDNVVKFYEMYAGDLDASVGAYNSSNVLDQWILAKLSNLIELCTTRLDAYDLLEPTREIREFIAELSQWYIRRSRDRFKGSDEEDKQFALATTQFVLDQLAVLMAPFTPFFAEDMYQRVGGNLESVHLESWPQLRQGYAGHVEEEYSRILENMRIAREIISDALELRAKANIKVRQPLARLQVAGDGLQDEYIELIKDEVNVKEVTFGDEMKLDIELTNELIAEGNARELIREIQKMRKTAGLNPDDTITLSIATDEEGQKVVETYRDEITTTAGVTNIVFEDNDAESIDVNGIRFGVMVK